MKLWARLFRLGLLVLWTFTVVWYMAWIIQERLREYSPDPAINSQDLDCPIGLNRSVDCEEQ